MEDVGSMNYKAGVREEKWGMLDLKNVQFPKTTSQSVKGATLLQHFEGIISPAAAVLMERSKMHYLDQSTFFAVLKDAWNRCEALDGMGLEQLEAALTKEYALCG